MNTPTPETDAFVTLLKSYSNVLEVTKGANNIVDFARTLERERDKAIRIQKITEKVWHSAESELTKTRDECDKLRKELADLGNQESSVSLDATSSDILWRKNYNNK